MHKHAYEVLIYAGSHGYPDLLMKAGIKAVKKKPVDVFVYAVRGGHNDLVKVAQPLAINSNPLRVMNTADDLGVDGLGEAAAHSAIQRGFEFQALEYAVQHELHACIVTAIMKIAEKRDSMRITEAVKFLSHRTLVAWVCTY